MSEQPNRFTGVKQNVSFAEDEAPVRLQRLSSPTAAPVVPRRRFEPNIPANPPVIRRHRSSSISSEASHAKHAELISAISGRRDRDNKQEQLHKHMKIAQPKKPSRVAITPGRSSSTPKMAQETQQKQLDENTWIAQFDEKTYLPTTLPFFNAVQVQAEESSAYDSLELRRHSSSYQAQSYDHLPMLTANNELNEETPLIIQIPSQLLDHVEHGNIGKIRVYESGRAVLVVGEHEFEVMRGTESTFYQELAVVDPAKDTIKVLGAVTQKMTIAPIIN